MTLAAGTFAQGEYAVEATGLAWVAGTWTGSGAMNVAGNISGADAGTISYTGTISQVGSGTVTWNTAGRAVPHLRLAWGTGVTSTLSGTTRCVKFSYGAGAIDISDKFIYVTPAASDFWTSGDGTFTCTTGFVIWTSATANRGVPDGLTQKAFTSTDIGKLAIVMDDTATLTASGAWDLGAADLNVVCDSGLGTGALDMDSFSLTAGGITLGNASTSGRWGSLGLGSGRHSITSIALAKAADTAGNSIDFATSNVVLTGTFDGSGITVTNASAIIDGGTVQDVTNGSMPPILHFNAAGFSGNTGVINPSVSQWARRHRGA